jgi:hypothetical protein
MELVVSGDADEALDSAGVADGLVAVFKDGTFDLRFVQVVDRIKGMLAQYQKR